MCNESASPDFPLLLCLPRSPPLPPERPQAHENPLRFAYGAECHLYYLHIYMNLSERIRKIQSQVGQVVLTGPAPFSSVMRRDEANPGVLHGERQI